MYITLTFHMTSELTSKDLITGVNVELPIQSTEVSLGLTDATFMTICSGRSASPLSVTRVDQT